MYIIVKYVACALYVFDGPIAIRIKYIYMQTNLHYSYWLLTTGGGGVVIYMVEERILNFDTTNKKMKIFSKRGRHDDGLQTPPNQSSVLLL